MEPNRIHGYTRDELFRMCNSKHRWSDELEATAGALQSLEQRPKVFKLYTYHCPACHGWHLTRSKQGGKRPIMLLDPHSPQKNVAASPEQGAPMCSVTQGVVEPRKAGR